ncbi:HWE histidine kinase domain-containing protein [Pseudomonas sp. DE0010]|uniref:HWE histidine kinase domain-containing protein n=1 Tax=Pseudomonas sp. DE0010 TaxID=2584951 RepID=UPI0011A52077|nr:HWE histidine kinase domain-containing protein [Pseudomonas sp. DE0010]
MTALVDSFRDEAIEIMANGESILPLLGAFVTALAGEMPGSHVGINILDNPGRTFRHSVFPSLPEAFSSKLTGNPISTNRGSCGLAIFSGKAIDVPDVASDHRFAAGWKSLFREYGLKALTSFPAPDKDGAVQGTIALIYDPQRPLTEAFRAHMPSALRLCAQLCAYSRTQEATEILVTELDHRMRNLFSTIGAVAVLTAKHHPEITEFRRVLQNRLVMMQKAHTLALAKAPTSLNTLVTETLAPYVTGTHDDKGGPHILLAPEAASALALVLHELATNAAKYGALSQCGGVVAFSWQIEEQMDSPPHFTFNWHESGGPVVTPPFRRGYGTLMMQGSLRNAFNGKVTFNYEPAGFSCQISAPFTQKLGQYLC